MLHAATAEGGATVEPNNKRATKRVLYFYSYRSHSLLFLVFVASPTAATATPDARLGAGAASCQPPAASRQ
jgi:hypothetical protein